MVVREITVDNSAQLDNDSAMETQTEPIKVGDLLTPRDVCMLLSVTYRTVLNWNKAGVLKPLNIGGALRYRRSDIEQLVNGRK